MVVRLERTNIDHDFNHIDFSIQLLVIRPRSWYPHCSNCGHLSRKMLFELTYSADTSLWVMTGENIWSLKRSQVYVCNPVEWKPETAQSTPRTRWLAGLLKGVPGSVRDRVLNNKVEWIKKEPSWWTLTSTYTMSTCTYMRTQEHVYTYTPT